MGKRKKLSILIVLLICSLTIMLVACVNETKNNNDNKTDTTNDSKIDMPSNEGKLLYTLRADNTYDVSGYEGKLYNIIIPKKYNDKEVKRIGDNAFTGNRELIKITIPNTIIEIGREAFAYCYNLKEVVFDESSILNKIGGSAFNYCSNLTQIQIPENVKVIENAMFQNSGIMDIKLPSNLEKIEDGAFQLCKNLKNISIPNSVKEIGKYVFIGCNIRDIVIPEGVDKLGEGILCGLGITIYCETKTIKDGWVDLWNIYGCKVVWDCKNNQLDEEGYKHIYVDNVKYGIKNKEAKIIFDYNKKTTIKSQITYEQNIYQINTIDQYAFFECTFDEIIIPETIETINSNAFNIENVKEIIIPKNVKIIKDNAFENNSRCKIFLEHTEVPIGFDTNWNKSRNQFIKYYLYSEKAPIDKNNYWCYINNEIAIW